MNEIFPVDAKVSIVSPIDEKPDNKNKISNYRPVSVLNIFSKVYKIVLKNELVSVSNDCNELASVLICLPLFLPIERDIAHNMFL